MLVVAGNMMMKLLYNVIMAALLLAGCTQTSDNELSTSRESPVMTAPVTGTAAVEIKMTTRSLRQMGLYMGERVPLTSDDFLLIMPEGTTEIEHETHGRNANIVYYALTTKHEVGEKQFERSGSRSTGNTYNCRSFYDSAHAQQFFLDSGGPEEDMYRLDPDGDGYACKWDPLIYRSLLFDPLAGNESTVVEIILVGPAHYEE